MPHRRAATAVLLALVTLPLAACAAGTGEATTPSATASAGAPATSPAAPTSEAASTEAFAPVSLDNCGTAVKVDTPPQRVVTIKSTPTEMLLALGLGDRIVGVGYQDGPVPDAWADEAATLPVLSDRVPNQESVLELDPDFVYGGWESNFSADGAGERLVLAERGIDSYVSPSACQDPEYQPDPLTFDEVFREISEVGDIFGVPEKAAALVEEQKAALAAIQPVSGVTAFWWSSGDDTPYAGGGIGSPQLIMSTAGVTNILADVPATWAPAGWEPVVAADPDVLVLVDATWNTYDRKVSVLESDPVLSQLTAVKNHRYVRLPFASTEAGVRNVEAAASVVEQVRDLGLGG